MRCSNCFQERSGITPAYPNTPPVCRGCARSLDGAVGWLETHGYALMEVATGQVLGVMSPSDSPPTPHFAPTPPSSLTHDGVMAEKTPSTTGKVK